MKYHPFLLKLYIKKGDAGSKFKTKLQIIDGVFVKVLIILM